MDIKAIQDYLVEHEIEAWLMADFHGRNSLAMDFLGISGFLTRRSFYLIPATGEPTAFVHAIEQEKFKHLPGQQVVFSGYKRLEELLKNEVGQYQKVAMEYSPNGRLPYIGLVEAGTIELVRSFNVEIVTSADLVARFQACLTVEQIALHRIAAGNVMDTKSLAFAFIKERIERNETIIEYDVVRFILDRFEQLDMETDHGPNCSINGNAGNPHYEPQAGTSAEIKKGDLILIDLWGKLKQPSAVYADITWMAFAGSHSDISSRYMEMFGAIRDARDAAVSFLRQHIGNQPVFGYEVDDVCREVVVKAGYGEYFTHRTGHSIGGDVHGTGPNIDNLETEDLRKLQQGHLFSIEPGVYMKECGFRTEIDVLIGYDGPEVTTLPLQSEILPLF
ncbi:MAG: M24 family metallopeptidase [bacterium]|nr:M24 family metallopeptidase [bacterium]